MGNTVKQLEGVAAVQDELYPFKEFVNALQAAEPTVKGTGLLLTTRVPLRTV